MIDWHWRPMTPTDLSGVTAVAKVAFPDHPEAPERFAERLRLSPGNCFVLADTDKIAGYLIAYHWPLGEMPALDAPLDELPERTSALYLHDLALLPEAGGSGRARAGIALLVDRAKADGFTTIGLVSVNDSAAFWTRLGFAEVTRDAALTRKLASYGPDARYMIRRV
ncbi:GNAT family N-acetyltransferase [Allosphingosinicella indica]|uniref:Acetyltransferase (GNAT) family protein n=1 Tax=Allosphingosinicella indica TaxID=941907 RepID=A0A1X7FYQ8_9SPHN|nr:GNAT family N-acetyltransferase [Allosphingosinicella indica]SMF60642.1 Acetyltransferase (GNAT) family protein [Allosphingosinicella indica]